ncbi:DUF2332 domain-containing protein [Microbacterium sediminicola]|uniref:DUF2332 domain-containing protein n=1 Tax=Microbacterium sediminicola TaxID=415210 RepID=A0ABN2I4C5_9MICO
MSYEEAFAVAERYARFAHDEAPGRSARYGEWAAGVATDKDVQNLLAQIPAHRRQPPLVFAVTRMLGAPEGDYAAWARWLPGHLPEVAEECTRRGLQTNEPLRCAALLPALSLVDGPIALLEIGASAGLCLYPDRYSYRYRGATDLDPPTGPSTVTLNSRWSGQDASLRTPEIVWRAGIDLAPVDVASARDRAFLAALVWPGETGRLARIEAAIDLVRAEPPRLVRGDATAPRVLTSLADTAPKDATLIITTPGVLPHIPRAGRAALFGEIDAARISRPRTRWVSLDPPALHDRWGATPTTAGGFVLGMDDRALGCADPLGAWVEWLPRDVSPRR